MARYNREEARAARQKAWSEWVASVLAERGWRQADLVKASGNLIKADRVSKWMTGKETPSYRNAIIVANVLELPHETVLEVAGYSPTATPDVEKARDIERAKRDIENSYTLPKSLSKALEQYEDHVLLAELLHRARARSSSFFGRMDDIEAKYRDLDRLSVGGSTEDDFTAEDYDVSPAPTDAFRLAAKEGKRKADRAGVADELDETADQESD